jgi:integrase-like protein
MASSKAKKHLVEHPEPLSHWQIDFKDVSIVPADQEGKQQHMVETCNIVDMGTSLPLQAQVRSDFSAETALAFLQDCFKQYGRPKCITFDRDPRWVGAPHGSDFPSALIRFCRCLDIDVQVCDPQQPQQNGFVERYHKTYKQECLQIEQPKTLEKAREVTDTFMTHYNEERPHQGISCGNRPPRTAFPELPTLPPVPTTVDPDHWLDKMDGWHIERKVDRHGMIKIDLKQYYVSSALAGQRVTIELKSLLREAHIYREHQLIKTISLKGMVGSRMSFEQFCQHMQHQARAQHRLRSLQEWQRRRRGEASV